jgi:hypothetical protein
MLRSIGRQPRRKEWASGRENSAGLRHPGGRFMVPRRVLWISILALELVTYPAWGQSTREATGKGGAYDFVAGLGYADTQQAKVEISDHLPVWAEFRTDGADDD